jgi:hypothetical protein
MHDAAMAGKLLRRCKELEPANPHWSHELGTLYSFQGDPDRPEIGTDWGLMSLAELETALRAAKSPIDRFHALSSIPRVCLKAGEIERARTYAEQLLADATGAQHIYTQICGNREASMVLGWYALYKNDFAEARSRLLGARVPDDAYFDSAYCHMDPLMQLIDRMLDWGQRDVVLEYLERDEQLVPQFCDRLSRWRKEIAQGDRPNFGDIALLGENLKLTGSLRPDDDFI